MKPYPVVEHLNIFKYFLFSLLSGLKFAMMGQFGFQGMKKAFSDRVIPAIPFTTHALYHTMLFQDLSVTVRRVLASSISMPDQSLTAMESEAKAVSPR